MGQLSQRLGLPMSIHRFRSKAEAIGFLTVWQNMQKLRNQTQEALKEVHEVCAELGLEELDVNQNYQMNLEALELSEVGVAEAASSSNGLAAVK